jgi:hypothetical protein
MIYPNTLIIIIEESEKFIVTENRKENLRALLKLQDKFLKFYIKNNKDCSMVRNI